MFDKFLNYIHDHGLFRPDDRVLLGISGGIDSMVMLHLFIRAKCNVGIAHCNFQLRGDESEGDEAFVRQTAEALKIPFFSRRFDTSEVARHKGISIQMAARELRYDWFENIRSDSGYHAIALAHNRSDQVETFLLNISRGTGIRGLTGIKPTSGFLIRPLLFASRSNIEQYSAEQKIEYREDSSNRTIKYSRNRIRHVMIPEFLHVNPRFEETVEETIVRLREVEQIYLSAIDEKKNNLLKQEGSFYTLNISELMNLKPLRTYLFEFLRGFNFSQQQIDDIIESLQASPGKQFITPTHRCLRDRDHLIITEYSDTGDEKQYYIEEDVREVTHPLRLKLFVRKAQPDEKFITDTCTACFDADQVLFPLILRKWRRGDYFYPFGMDSLKKISDFFVDNKFSLFEKESTWLMVSGNKIMWIIGKRIDNRFRVTSRTTRILEIHLLD